MCKTNERYGSAGGGERLTIANELTTAAYATDGSSRVFYKPVYYVLEIQTIEIPFTIGDAIKSHFNPGGMNVSVA